MLAALGWQIARENGAVVNGGGNSIGRKPRRNKPDSISIGRRGLRFVFFAASFMSSNQRDDMRHLTATGKFNFAGKRNRIRD